MSDLKCPYCNHKYEHDGDFEGLDSHNEMGEWCPECNMRYKVYVDFYPSFSQGDKVPCWNGGEHEFKVMGGYAEMEKCSGCGETRATREK